MNELINITENDGKKAVSAKELYLGLGLRKADWSRWYKTNIEENEYFLENESWVGVPQSAEGNETLDFAISIEFAKHIAMMARTEKSHEYRNYFLECEKQLQTDTSALSPELQMFNQMFQVLAKTELEQKRLEAAVNETHGEVQAIRDTLIVVPNDWRDYCINKIRKIAYDNDVKHETLFTESYKALEQRAGCDLERRLKGRRERAEQLGTSKSKIDKFNYLDVIGDDKKLIEIYLQIVKEMAIKNKVA